MSLKTKRLVLEVLENLGFHKEKKTITIFNDSGHVEALERHFCS